MDEINSKKEKSSNNLSILISLIDAHTTLSIIAFACYWAWIFTCYWGGVLNPSSETLSSLDYISRSGALCAQALGLGFIAIFWKTFSTTIGQRFLTIFMIACAPLSSLSVLLPTLGIPVSDWLTIAFFFLFGCAHAFLFLRIGLILDTINGRVLSFSIAIAVLTSCAFYAFLITLSGEVQLITLMIVPWVCCLMVFAARPSGKLIIPNTMEDSKQGKGNYLSAAREFRYFFIQLLLYSIVFSAIQMFMSFTPIIFPQETIMGVAILVSGAVMLIYSIAVSRYVPAGSFLWYLLPIVALALLPLSLVDGQGQIICFLIVAFGFTCFDMLSVYQLTGLIKFHNLSVVRYFALGRFANALGMAIGWLFALGLISIVNSAEMILAYGSTALVSLLVIILAVLNKPSIKISPSAPISDDSAMRKPWKQCCTEICEQSGLSPREIEVFIMLARGRTARMICEKLYISESTAKSHIYHIYQKTGFHTHQELIEEVEKRYYATEAQT